MVDLGIADLRDGPARDLLSPLQPVAKTAAFLCLSPRQPVDGRLVDALRSRTAALLNDVDCVHRDVAPWRSRAEIEAAESSQFSGNDRNPNGRRRRASGHGGSGARHVRRALERDPTAGRGPPNHFRSKLDHAPLHAPFPRASRMGQSGTVEPLHLLASSLSTRSSFCKSRILPRMSEMCCSVITFTSAQVRS